MVQRLDQRVKLGLRKVFEQAGQPATWYRYSGSAAGSPEYGIAGVETYITGTLAVLQGDLTPAEMQVAGGQITRAQFALLVREPVSQQDMFRIGTGAQYRVAGPPTTAIVGGACFYRLILERAGAG